MNKEETTAWIGLREIYRLIGSEEGNKIIRILIKTESAKSSELMEASGIPAAKFYALMKALVLCQVVEKKVHMDRGVSYGLSPFGKNVLDLSEPLLDKIRDTFKDKDSLLLSVVQQHS